MVSATQMYFLETDDAHAACGTGEMQQPDLDGFGVATFWRFSLSPNKALVVGLSPSEVTGAVGLQ